MSRTAKPTLAELLRRRREHPTTLRVPVPVPVRVPVSVSPVAVSVPNEPDLVPYGNLKAYDAIRRHMEGWNSPDAKPLLVIGPPGVGKTFLVEQLAARMQLSVRRIGCCEMVLNNDLVKVFERALKNYDLTRGRRCIVLLGSLDGLSDLVACAPEGKFDSKGMATHLDVLLGPTTRRPYRVFITVNDKGSALIRKLASVCTQTWMNRPDRAECARFAEAYLRGHRLIRNEQLVRALSNECLGDLRGFGNNILFYSRTTTALTGHTGCRDVGATPFDLCRDALHGVPEAVEQLATSAHELHYQIIADNYLTLKLDETLDRVANIAHDLSLLHHSSGDMVDDYKEALTRDICRLARHGAYPKQLAYDRNRTRANEEEDKRSPLVRAFQNEF